MLVSFYLHTTKSPSVKKKLKNNINGGKEATLHNKLQIPHAV